MAKDQFVLAQVSDMHFGDARFDPSLALAVVDEINESVAQTMKTNPTAMTASTTTSNPDAKFLGPCVIAALVWFVLTVYVYYVIPAQLDVREVLTKQPIPPSQPLKIALFFNEMNGSAIVSIFGTLGCGLAYIRKNSRLANWMIVLGAIFLGALIYAVLSNIGPH